MSLRNAVLLSVLGLFLALGCRNLPGGVDVKNDAISAANEIAIICDSEIWESAVHDTVLYYFQAPYPIMPQPEPIFDIRHFSTEDLIAVPLRRELRTYVILADLSDADSETTRLVKADLGDEKYQRAKTDSTFISSAGIDKWAKDQLIVYVFGDGLDALAKNIVKSYPAVSKRITEHDRRLIDAATYLNKESLQVSNRIREKFDVTMRIPGDYQIAVERENFIWIRQDFDVAISNITIMRFAYESPAQLELDGIITMRDRMGVMVEGASLGSYMQTNREDLPVYLYKKEIDGHYAVECRGIWELSEDFLGGPFVTYAIVDSSDILLVDAFVHAPGKDKRNYVQRLEHIVSSLKF